MFTFIFQICFVVILVFIIVQFAKSIPNKSEGKDTSMLLSGFTMIQDFVLIQNWNGNDIPYGIIPFRSSAKQDTYVAIGTKNNKTYLIIKQSSRGFMSFQISYLYLEQSSFEKMINLINTKKTI